MKCQACFTLFLCLFLSMVADGYECKTHLLLCYHIQSCLGVLKCVQTERFKTREAHFLTQRNERTGMQWASLGRFGQEQF